MDFGVVLQTDPPARRVIDLAVLAERNGFSHGWAFDSHVLWQEPFVIFSQMLANTERMIVGPMVTNPGTRDATVVASMFATLDEMFDGRTIWFHFLGEVTPEIEQLTAELAQLYEAKVKFRQFTDALVNGCGPNCGTEAAEGGCDSCTTCAVSGACGS